MTSACTRENVSIGVQIPVARRPNDGVLFPTYPSRWQRIREHDVKSLACRMSHHSFRVTRADVTCRCLCTCSYTSPSVRVQHRVRADFERRRPGGRRTFISRIGLHDRHLITTAGIPLIYSVFTPPIPFHLTLFLAEGVLYPRAGEGACRSLSSRVVFEIALVPLGSLMEFLRDGIHFSNRDEFVVRFAFLIVFKVAFVKLEQRV